MAKLVLNSCRIFAGGTDLTGVSNRTTFTGEVEPKETTNFGSGGWKEFIGGLASAAVDGGGQWEAGTAANVDDQAWADMGSVIPYSVFPVDANEGSVGYFMSTLRDNYTFFGALGDVAAWTATGKSSWPAARGLSLEAPGTARTVTGSGTAVQLGAVPAGQRLYAALHVLSVAGTGSPTLTVRVQSDTVGFPSPTTQIAFTAATAIGGQIARTAVGAITDDYVRADWTISGSSPSFLFVVTCGIAV